PSAASPPFQGGEYLLSPSQRGDASVASEGESSCLLKAFEDRPILHHETDTARGRDVTRRVAFQRDHISEQAFFHTAEPVFHVKPPRMDGRGGTQCVHR